MKNTVALMSLFAIFNLPAPSHAQEHSRCENIFSFVAIQPHLIGADAFNQYEKNRENETSKKIATELYEFAMTNNHLKDDRKFLNELSEVIKKLSTITIEKTIEVALINRISSPSDFNRVYIETIVKEYAKRNKIYLLDNSDILGWETKNGLVGLALIAYDEPLAIQLLNAGADPNGKVQIRLLSQYERMLDQLKPMLIKIPYASNLLLAGLLENSEAMTQLLKLGAKPIYLLQSANSGNLMLPRATYKSEVSILIANEKFDQAAVVSEKFPYTDEITITLKKNQALPQTSGNWVAFALKISEAKKYFSEYVSTMGEANPRWRLIDSLKDTSVARGLLRILARDFPKSEFEGLSADQKNLIYSLSKN